MHRAQAVKARSVAVRRGGVRIGGVSPGGRGRVRRGLESLCEAGLFWLTHVRSCSTIAA